jgi:hypothetical protein
MVERSMAAFEALPAERRALAAPPLSRCASVVAAQLEAVG